MRNGSDQLVRWQTGSCDPEETSVSQLLRVIDAYLVTLWPLVAFVR